MKKDVPTFEEFKASGAKPASGVHAWMRFAGIVCCAWCGSTNRERDKPCRGVVRVELRTSLTPKGQDTQKEQA